MAKDDEATDDPPAAAWARMAAEIPADTPVHRLDYGDADQRIEMDGTDELTSDEPLEMVDAPVQIRKPFSRADKQRNQRRLPT
ncbi:hypothetical protein ACI2K4_32255 [Micromonospora sp. NPDC050397]|uniref:hypothetical protein n=1 Tax=Micromonospora sp. NPDC050397 TaxID=3364279 RepID=UPI00384AC59C